MIKTEYKGHTITYNEQEDLWVITLVMKERNRTYCYPKLSDIKRKIDDLTNSTNNVGHNLYINRDRNIIRWSMGVKDFSASHFIKKTESNFNKMMTLCNLFEELRALIQKKDEINMHINVIIANLQLL